MSTSQRRGPAVIKALQRYNTSPVVFAALVLGTALGTQIPAGAFAGALGGVLVGVLAELSRRRLVRPSVEHPSGEK